MTADARSPEQRKADTLEPGSAPTSTLGRVGERTDGDAYLVPLSYCWDGSTLTVATPRSSPTARNLIRAGRARIALGPTRDVVIVEGPVEAIAIGADVALEDAHAQATGFDPRTLATEYVYLQIAPQTIQAWREANEIAGRTLMRDGAWLI